MTDNQTGAGQDQVVAAVTGLTRAIVAALVDDPNAVLLKARTIRNRNQLAPPRGAKRCRQAHWKAGKNSPILADHPGRREHEASSPFSARYRGGGQPTLTLCLPSSGGDGPSDGRHGPHGTSTPHGCATHPHNGHSADAPSTPPHTVVAATHPESRHSARGPVPSIPQPRHSPRPVSVVAPHSGAEEEEYRS